MYSNEEVLCFNQLKSAVIDMEQEDAVNLAKTIREKNYSPEGAVKEGLIKGMEEVSNLYEQKEYFIPELLACAETMNEALEILKPLVKKGRIKTRGTVVIGSIWGDTHDIGKNIVALFLESAGFKVYDLGRDITPERFVEKALEVNADVIAISTLMTTTMEHMKGVIDELESRNLRQRFKVIIGGKPVSSRFAKDIGADGYSATAGGAVRLVNKIINI